VTAVHQEAEELLARFRENGELSGKISSSNKVGDAGENAIANMFHVVELKGMKYNCHKQHMLNTAQQQ
jgi:hypothetical protein